MNKEKDRIRNMFSLTVKPDEADRILSIASRIPGVRAMVSDYDEYKELGKRYAVTVTAYSAEAITEFSNVAYPRRGSGNRKRQ